MRIGIRIIFLFIFSIVLFFGCSEKEQIASPASPNQQFTIKAKPDTLTAMMPSTSIYFSLPVNAYVRMGVVNSRNEEMAILINNQLMAAGYYSVTFNATLASGVYKYYLLAGTSLDMQGNITGQIYFSSRKMLLIK